MNKRNKGLNRLRAINPVDETSVDGPDSPRAAELLTRITATPRDAHEHTLPGRKPLRLAITVAAAALATIAAVWVWTQAVERPTAISCYQAVDLDADIAAAPAGGPATADACEPVWADGVLTNTDIAPRWDIPPLTACVADNGSLAVFPTDDATVCEELGLAYPEPLEQDQADDLRTLEEDLIAYFQTEECPTIEAAATRVRQILDRAGFTQWTIQKQPESPQRPCASHSLDEEARTIILIPIPAD